VINVDTRHGGFGHDITRSVVRDSLLELVDAPDCVGVLASFPCKTWSTARYNQPGPPLLRDLENLEGFRDAAGNLPPKVQRANATVDAGVEVLAKAHERGLPVIVEAPPSNASGEHAIEGREGHAAMWTLPSMARLVTAMGALFHVGALIYGVPCGRIDVAFVVGILARCLTFPVKALTAYAERTLVYLGQHASDGLTYDGTVTGADVLVGYSDSNWSVAHSTSGYTIELANASVCYSSKRQHCIALSSTEAEIIAASAAACEIVYLRGLLAEMGVPQTAPTVLYVDNQGAVELSKDAKTCHRSRHVLRRFFKVRELVHSGEVVVKWVDTNANKADLLTKSSFSPATFDKLKAMSMSAKNISHVSFTGLPINMVA